MAGEVLRSTGKNLLPNGFGSRPWLFHMDGTQKQTTTFVDPISHCLEEKVLPGVQGKTCFGCYGDWILLSDELTRDCFFLNTITFSKIYIPPIPKSPDFFGTNVRMTAPPDTANCLVILVCYLKTFLLLWSPGSKRWKKVHLQYLTKNVDSLRGGSAVYKKWLFVVTVLDFTLAIDIAALARGSVEMIVIDRLKGCPIRRAWSACLVKCADDLFYVQLHSYGDGQIIVHVEVRRLELSIKDSNTMRWRRVQDIGDYTFFLTGRRGRSIPANKSWGTQRNCIYYPIDWSDGVRLYKFCLDDQILSFTILTKNTNDLNRLQWAFPRKILPAIVEDNSNSIDALRFTETDSAITAKEGENEMVVSRKWDELPLEMVELLSARLSLVDCLRLPSVCKAWSQAYTEKGKVWPWLMHLPNLKYRSCKFFDPFYCKEYTITNDVLAASDHLALRFSKNGWVVVTEGNQRVFLFNPFTGKILDLPSLKHDYIFNGVSFLSVPTSPDFEIFGFYFQVCGEFVEISKWRPGEEEWTTFEFQGTVPFFPSFNNPVFFRGEFCCLGRKGEIGVFNSELETWTVLSKPEPVYLVEPGDGDEYCYLLESNGELISVFKTDDTEKEVRVFRLEQSDMAWRKLEHLGDMTLFVDARNSIAIPCPEKEYANKIYVTRWGGGDSKKGVFYSMEDHKYYPSVRCVEEPSTCVWMEPDLSIHR